MNPKSYRQVYFELNNLWKDRIILSVFLFKESFLENKNFNSVFWWQSCLIRLNIKANDFSNLFLSDSGKRVPNCFGFTTGYCLVIELPVGGWILKPSMKMLVAWQDVLI